MAKIKQLRDEIDLLDKQIMDSLERRFSIAKQIGTIKKEKKLGVYDKNREKCILSKTATYSYSPLIESIYKEIFTQSKNIQK